jgi:hypothetical protein
MMLTARTFMALWMADAERFKNKASVPVRILPME